MLFPFRLQTKIVIAITGLVSAIVIAQSSLYVRQVVKQLTDDTFKNAEFFSLQVYQASRDALESDLADPRLKIEDEGSLQQAVEESLQTDAALNSLMQSIVGYSPTIYDIAITDIDGRAIMHSDAGMIGQRVPERREFEDIRNSDFTSQLVAMYGKRPSPSRWANIRSLLSGTRGDQEVYEYRLPLRRSGQPFATVRVGISTVFLKNALQPKLKNALLLSGVAFMLSLLLAAILSNLTLRPLARISRKLDDMSAASVIPAVSGEEPVARERRKAERKDEYGVVNTKIDRLGQQMKDVKEVFSALQENLDQIMSNLQDGVMLFTRDEKAVMVSASIEQFLHKSRAELMGRGVQEIFAERPRLGHPILEAFANHQPITQLELLTDSLQDAAPGRVQISLDFIEENGERIGALLTLRDAESVHRIEDELELSRRLAAVGRLTSGVAHEVKNPINAIVVHLEVLRQKLKELDPDTRRHMDVIGSEIRRLDRVVQTLVDFTRPVNLRLTEIDLRRVLDEVIQLATPDAEKHGVHLLRDISDDVLPVRVDADLVKQAILNVVINGMQAMASKGSGTMRLVALPMGHEAVIEIQDDGGGIPEKIREKIFNLYFTTKSGGSGIGLPMTYRVVQLHNGSMDFDSVEGVGTTFRLRFPMVDMREFVAEATGASSSSTVEGHSTLNRE